MLLGHLNSMGRLSIIHDFAICNQPIKLPSQKNDISSTVSSDSNVQRASHDCSRWKQDSISDMSKTPAKKEAQAAQCVSLWKERILGKRFIEHWWQRSAPSVRLNQCTPDLVDLMLMTSTF